MSAKGASLAVTFIIPSFNQGRFIGCTLDSILAQNLPAESYEILVFDGGSNDGTVEVLRTHPSRPEWTSGPDGGQTEAVNKGLARARGDIIAWINSDDFYYPGALRTVLAVFDADPEVGVIYGKANHVDIAGDLIAPYPTEAWDSRRLESTCFICQPAAFFRREVVARRGPLDASLRYSMDYEFWLRLKDREKIRFIGETLAASRVYPETKTLRDKPGVFRECLLVVHRHTGRWNGEWLCGLAHWRAVAVHPRAGAAVLWIHARLRLCGLVLRCRIFGARAL